jgi:hypothetical protein
MLTSRQQITPEGTTATTIAEVEANRLDTPARPADGRGE